MNAFLLSIGDELASGLTVNTNSAWLAEQLSGLGISAMAHVTVGDDLQAIATAIRAACEHLEARLDPSDKAALLLITGGLGPTEDDLTRQALADALNQELVEDPDAMLQVERFFKSIHRPMAASNRLQALRPHGASIIENPAGTAPGLRARKDSTEIFVLPGVPREMKEMFTRSVRPELEARQAGASGGGAACATQVVKINTFGLGESNLGEKISDLMARRPEVSAGARGAGTAGVSTRVGTTVHEGIVSVRLYATGPRVEAQTEIARLREVVRQRLGPLVFSEGEEPLEGVVTGLLLKAGRTVATAESCTGGLLAMMLTNMAGASAYFLRGWVTYANSAKEEELAVPAELLAAHGAVSEAVARAMADHAKRAAQSDFALATTGIAGPDGGTLEKPVGTVWIALATPRETTARKFIFPGNRQQVRLRAAQMALALLRWHLSGVATPI
jgi:nicotinamide-nucleotide amidase